MEQQIKLQCDTGEDTSTYGREFDESQFGNRNRS